MDGTDKQENGAGQAGAAIPRTRDGKRKNDDAWAAFFSRTETLAQIDERGFSYITADQLNALKMRVVSRILWAWVLTIPAAGGVAYGLVKLARACGWLG